MPSEAGCRSQTPPCDIHPLASSSRSPGPRFAPDTGMQNAVRETLGNARICSRGRFTFPVIRSSASRSSCTRGSTVPRKDFGASSRRSSLRVARRTNQSTATALLGGATARVPLFSQDTRGVTTNERCIPSPPARRPGVIVCALLVGGDPNQIKIVQDGLRFTTAP